MERDRYFTPAEAREYGLVDRVMNGRAGNGGPPETGSLSRPGAPPPPP
jgi:hypothetical protein